MELLSEQTKTHLSESGFFYFIFDPDVVADIMKTKLGDEDLNGRCSHLKRFDQKYQIAELGFQRIKLSFLIGRESVSPTGPKKTY